MSITIKTDINIVVDTLAEAGQVRALLLDKIAELKDEYSQTRAEKIIYDEEIA